MPRWEKVLPVREGQQQRSWTSNWGESKSFDGKSHSAVLGEGLNSTPRAMLFPWTCTDSKSTCFCHEKSCREMTLQKLNLSFRYLVVSLSTIHCIFSFLALLLLHVAMSEFHCYSIYWHERVDAVSPQQHELSKPGGINPSEGFCSVVKLCVTCFAMTAPLELVCS